MSDRLVYYDDCGSDEACLGRKIYHAALDDRRGFRPDQIGIPTSDDVWLEIFEGIGKAALERAEAAEAKLAKAVEALTRIDDLTCHNMPMTAREEQGVNREARAALAELEEQTDG